MRLEFKHPPIGLENLKKLVRVYAENDFGQNPEEFQAKCRKIGLEKLYKDDSGASFRITLDDFYTISGAFNQDYFLEKPDTFVVSTMIACPEPYSWTVDEYLHEIGEEIMLLLYNYRDSIVQVLGNPWLDTSEIGSHYHDLFADAGNFCLWRVGQFFICLGLVWPEEPTLYIQLSKVNPDIINRFDLGEFRFEKAKTPVRYDQEESFFNEIRTGKYVLSCFTSKRCFAHIEVAIIERGSVNSFVDRTIENPEHLEVSAQSQSAWIKAAKNGILQTLECLATTRGRFFEARLLRVRGLEPDTSSEDVRAAAALAVWNAVFPDLELPKLQYDNTWTVVYPNKASS